MKLLLVLVAALLIFAAPARAEEQLLTLYSPPIDSEPYVHKSTTVVLKADGVGAPKEPGYVLGFQEQSLVDSKDPDAKPLPVSKMMVHHFLYYTRGRVDPGPGGCLGGDFLSGRGEEHPDGRFDAAWPPEQRARLRRAQRHARRHGARVDADRDGHEPLQADQALLRPHPHLVHDRAAHAALPGLDRRLPPPRQRHVLRRPGRRQAGLGVRRPLAVDGAVRRADPRRRVAPSRRRDAPDALERHLRAAR